jgi:predicted GIY-YIG superfamily endonuclease
VAKAGRTAVYEFFARTGRHVYIGISNDPEERAAQHAADKWWWESVDHKRSRVTWYSTRAKALAVEARMIARHRPPGNKQHNPDWEQSPAGRLYRSKSARRRRPRAHLRRHPAAGWLLAVSFAAGLFAFLEIGGDGVPNPPVLWTLIGISVVAGVMANARR